LYDNLSTDKSASALLALRQLKKTHNLPEFYAQRVILYCKENIVKSIEEGFWINESDLSSTSPLLTQINALKFLEKCESELQIFFSLLDSPYSSKS
jgi:hypothetical protein